MSSSTPPGEGEHPRAEHLEQGGQPPDRPGVDPVDPNQPAAVPDDAPPDRPRRTPVLLALPIALWFAIGIALVVVVVLLAL